MDVLIRATVCDSDLPNRTITLKIGDNYEGKPLLLTVGESFYESILATSYEASYQEKLDKYAAIQLQLGEEIIRLKAENKRLDGKLCDADYQHAYNTATRNRRAMQAMMKHGKIDLSGAAALMIDKSMVTNCEAIGATLGAMSETEKTAEQAYLKALDDYITKGQIGKKPSPQEAQPETWRDRPSML